VALCERRAGLLVALLFALGALALWPTLKLELHTSLLEILPREHPAVQAFERVGPRQISSTNLVLIVESPDAAKNRAFIEALKPKLSPLIGKLFTEIQWKPETEVPEFAAKQKWLYAPLEDLGKAESLLDRLIASRKHPLVVDLEDKDPEDELKELRERLNQKLPHRDDSPFFEVRAKDGLFHDGVMLWRRGGGLASVGDQEFVDEIKKLIAEVGPEKFDPKMQVEYSGAIPAALAEQEAVRDDLSFATTVCASLVLLAIWLYFRRLAVLLVVGAPAVLGVLLSLALARFTIHYLNQNTAFLISIILGNGINTPIVLMARYGEERRAGAAVGPAMASAMASTFRGTLAAMIATSIAYGCLLVTSLRGLNQFGLVGGAGMMLVWAMTFLLVPPAVLLGERWKPGLLTPRENWWRPPFRAIGRLGERAPGWLAAIVVVGCAVAVLPAWRYLKDPLEYNFDNLRMKNDKAARLWQLMYDLGMGNVGAGYIATDGVILVDTPEQADQVADAIWAEDQKRGDKRVLKAVHTLNKWLPEHQKEKLEKLQAIRAKIDANRRYMEDDEAAEVQRWRPPDDLHALTVNELPKRIRENFTEVDGTMGRFVGLDADPTRYVEGNGRELIRLSRALEVTTLGKRWVAMATATVFAGMLETIQTDGPKLLLFAAAGVALLCLIVFGVRGSLPVMLSLLLGVGWLIAFLGVYQLKLNFLNFVAVPITLGIGTEYAANLWARLQKERETSISEVIGETGSAVALCSLTTIIGYSSLLLARNGALQSFGKVADLGEITSLATALLVLPVVVWIVGRRRSAKSD
jgi:predicted RND superfamily exporter protein